MSNERDVLDIWKERIRKEAKHGDKKKACYDAGISYQTLRNAMDKNEIEELSSCELLALQKLIERLDARKEHFEKIRLQYAN